MFFEKLKGGKNALYPKTTGLHVRPTGIIIAVLVAWSLLKFFFF
jgi:hypothetical protein